ncbi:hypothetical protein NBRC116597_38060 [Phaeobacter sp. NW0010-22]
MLPAWLVLFKSDWNGGWQSEMAEVFLVALSSLGIVLYIQARLAAREIRRNRAKDTRDNSVTARSLG